MVPVRGAPPDNDVLALVLRYDPKAAEKLSEGRVNLAISKGVTDLEVAVCAVESLKGGLFTSFKPAKVARRIGKGELRAIYDRLGAELAIDMALRLCQVTRDSRSLRVFARFTWLFLDPDRAGSLSPERMVPTLWTQDPKSCARLQDEIITGLMAALTRFLRERMINTSVWVPFDMDNLVTTIRVVTASPLTEASLATLLQRTIDSEMQLIKSQPQSMNQLLQTSTSLLYLQAVPSLFISSKYLQGWSKERVASFMKTNKKQLAYIAQRWAQGVYAQELMKLAEQHNLQHDPELADIILASRAWR